MNGRQPGEHRFDAVAYLDNVPLRELAGRVPEARPGVAGLTLQLGEGTAYLFPFGAVAFLDAPRSERDGFLARLPFARTQTAVREDFLVRVAPEARTQLQAGHLVVDELGAARAGVVALTVAQSAAFECYEAIVAEQLARATRLVTTLERRGSIPLSLRPLRRFVGEALATRHEVLSVMHLLDKPDAVWDDPAMDRIYADLRGEFDLGDRFDALSTKLGGVQETLTLLLDTARDQRLELLEAAIVVLIVLEIILGLLQVM